uniref:Retrovirus-related Pol polyprotein from transposon TNT 1-94 n=1 Tax=Tanacetum cinerariifolium TaxID=118510 RepID=A0A699J2I7_TANCI|nr:hypothetical protein [Tanacetum cinerariifolium]
MVEQAKLKLDLVGKSVDHTDDRSMIGSLMYVTSSRPDIMFATCMCARYQANPNEHHLSAIKRIFRYLKGTINLGLWYPKDFGFDLTAYLDADHAGCHLNRKTESEYVTVSSCCAQVLWMRTQLTDYGFFYDKVSIYCDSKSAIAISCNPAQHTSTKHIDVRYHFIKDHVEKGTIELYFVDTEYQLADLFMKSLPVARFKFLVEKLGMMKMDHSNPTFTKIPILDTGKFEQWKFKIQQYLQNENYALWEVIEFGDSYKAHPEETGKGPASESSARKKGRTVAITTEDMQNRRNYVKARITLLLALPDEHQLRFSKYETAKELWEAILKTFGGNEATKKKKKN